MPASRLHSALECQMLQKHTLHTAKDGLELPAPAFVGLPAAAAILSSSPDGQQQPQHQHGHTRVCLEPKEIYAHIAEGGEAKHKGSFLREVVLGILAGCFIGFGFSTCMLAAGQMNPSTKDPGLFNLLFGAYGFPVGLSMCVINGASLFTSNIAYMMAAFMENKVSGPRCLFIVALSYFTNLLGSLLLVGLMLSGDVFLHREEFTKSLAIKKTSSSFGATLTKGILCNWLVCMAVWQGNAAQDITGKLLGIWFPISAFVTMGFEHCIANMFVIPLAIKLGAPLTVADFITKNLIPATIGNLIGGGFFVATSYGLAYGAWGEAVSAAAARCWARAAPKWLLLHGAGGREAAAAAACGGGAGSSSAGGSSAGSSLCGGQAAAADLLAELPIRNPLPPPRPAAGV